MPKFIFPYRPVPETRIDYFLVLLFTKRRILFFEFMW